MASRASVVCGTSYRRRRGFYFSMDVLLFLFIIAFGTVLVLAALPGRAPKTQPLSIADSLASFLATTTTRHVIGYTSGITFTSLDHTILAQAILFIEEGDEATARKFVTQIIEGTRVVPDTYMAEVEVVRAGSPISLYRRATRPQSESDILISSKRIIFFYDKGLNRVIGPDVAQVSIW